MDELEKIRRYTEKTKLSRKTKCAYCMHLDETNAFHEALRRDEFRAMGLIFVFGQAKGYRAAKAEARHGKAD